MNYEPIADKIKGDLKIMGTMVRKQLEKQEIKMKLIKLLKRNNYVR